MNRLLTAALAATVALGALHAENYTLTSPDGRISVAITAADSLTYSVSLDGMPAFSSPAIGLRLTDGTTPGRRMKPGRGERRIVSGRIASPLYRNDSITEAYNQLTLRAGKDWRVCFRAYDDGVAYRWIYTGRRPVEVASEQSGYRFAPGAVATVPYVNRNPGTPREQQYFNSFENSYNVAPIDSLDHDRLIFTPAMVEQAPVNVCITESALEDYPGMFLIAAGPDELLGEWAPAPARTEQGGHNRLQQLVRERHPYIAAIAGPRALPWRVATVTDSHVAQAQSELVYLLADPSRVADISWIRPGKVAWEWWNDWNVTGVPFATGINNDTYKAYIDFAGRNGIEYVILDEGWAVNLQADLMQVVPEIDIPELVAYGRERGVGIILWAGYHAFERDMENVCRHYADMGVKGFKVDFMDRDDQQMTAFNHRAAECAARHGLVLDLHGTHKPAGLNRTWPNVLNFEGVNGLEQMKWAPASIDQVTYDTQIPFLRQVAGPMDYTQGAMRNASRGSYYPCYSEPMSQGTRAHQLALYMILDSPLNMLCDAPSSYEANPACTRFIASVPTVWQRTLVLQGHPGQYAVTARRHGDDWWLGGITGREGRDVELTLDFLPAGEYEAEIIADGANARRAGADHSHRSATVKAGSKLNLHMAPGGGFAMRLTPKR